MTLTRRLLLLALIAVLPAIVIWTYTEVALRQAREAEVHDLALRQARLAASELDRILDGIRNVLVAVGEVPSVRDLDTARCVPYLAGLQARMPHLVSIAALDRDGVVRCRQAVPPADMRFADRSYFKEALAGAPFVIGEYTEGRIAKQPVLPLAVPLHDADGKIAGVVAGALDLAWLDRELGQRSMPEGGSIAVADRNGVYLAREPQPERFVGSTISEPLRHLVSARQPGVIEATAADGTRRVVGYVPAGNPPRGVFVGVGLSSRDAYSTIDEAARRGFLLIAAAFVLALLLAWLIGRAFVTKPFAIMTDAVGSWRNGSYDSRIDGAKLRGEFAVLGGAFNDLMDDIGRRQRAVQDSEERARLALDAGEMGTWWLDPRRRIIGWSSKAAVLLGLAADRTEATYGEWAALLDPADRPGAEEALAAALAGDGDYEAEYRVLHADGSERWINARGRVFFDGAGKPTRIIGIVQDVTERRLAEEQQRLLLDELNHRVKNTLATVQSIASQTLRASPEPERFRQAFESRLLALSKTHDLLTRNAWREADLDALLEQELTPYRRDGDARILLDGPSIRLPARMAINLGLVVHELVTNAAKYGALSTPLGRLDIRWRVEQRDGGTVLQLGWRESNGPLVLEPTRHGFGSRLIRRSVEGELDGRLALTFAPTGLVAELLLPIDDGALVEPRPAAGFAVAV